MKRFFVYLTFILIPLVLSGLGLLLFLAGLRATYAYAQDETSNSLIWPISGSSLPDVDKISSPFGPRWQFSQQRNDYHPGIDIVAPMSTTVHVITDGVVTTVGWLSPSSGLTVIVSHTLAGYYSAYLHLNSTPVSVTQAVTQGDVIGYVGETGTTDFVHLHLEIRVSRQGYPGNTRNPMGYLPRPDLTIPMIQITSIDNFPVYSPTVSLTVTIPRDELDINQLRVILQDRASGEVLDDELVDFNLRFHTGEDDLDQDGIRLTPTIFNTSTQEYELGAYFYQLLGMDAFTLTAQVIDLDGHTASAITTGEDTTLPGRVSDLSMHMDNDEHVTLRWTAPGDSGNIGTAASYEIRYFNHPLNNANWDQATPIDDPPSPLPSGSVQTFDFHGQGPEFIYFALKTTDPEANISPISNSAGNHWISFFPILIR